MSDFTIADAYEEACRALGEAIVAQRLLSRQVAGLNENKPSGNTGAP